MDPPAVTHCMEHGLPVIVLSLREEGSVRRALLGEPVGTRIGA